MRAYLLHVLIISLVCLGVLPIRLFSWNHFVVVSPDVVTVLIVIGLLVGVLAVILFVIMCPK